MGTLEATPLIPRENISRELNIPVETRASEVEGGMPILRGHMAVFNTWSEIASASEGHFMERIVPGAFAKTFSENRDRIKVTFNHGHDPSMGDKVLGQLTVLEEDERGAYYEAPLFDTHYNRELLPGLEAGQYGSSFRFTVLQEDIEHRPERSAHNPEGLVERSITEARVYEGGPVTWPQYPEAESGVHMRSITDEYVFEKFAQDPKRLSEIIDHVRQAAPITPPETAGGSHREAEKPTPKFRSREEFLQWMSTN